MSRTTVAVLTAALSAALPVCLLAACSRTDGEVEPLTAATLAPAPSVAPPSINTDPAKAPAIPVPTVTAYSSTVKPGGDCAQYDAMKPDEPVPDFLAAAALGTPYRSLVQGATHVYYTRVPGRVADLVTVRDVVDARITAAGLKIIGAEEESGTEAESGFSGAHTGQVNVQVLCRGQLVVRFRVES